MSPTELDALWGDFFVFIIRFYKGMKNFRRNLENTMFVYNSRRVFYCEGQLKHLQFEEEEFMEIFTTNIMVHKTIIPLYDLDLAEVNFD